MNMKIKAVKTFQRLILAFTIVWLAIMAIVSFFYLPKDTISALPGFVNPCFLIVPATIVMFVLIYWIYKHSIRFNRLQTNCAYAFILLMQIMGLAYVLYSGLRINHDTIECFNEAVEMVESGTGKINNGEQDGYFTRYSNNHFFVILLYYYFRILNILGIDAYYTALIVLNVILIDIAVLIVLRTVRLLFGHKTESVATIFTAFCPTLYIFVDFAYTTTFSMPIIALYCYYVSKQLKKKSLSRFEYILLGLSLGVGISIRATVIIPGIAFLIVLLMQKMQFRKKILILITQILIVTSTLFFINTAIVPKHQQNPNSNSYFPYTHWIMMGLKGDGYVDGSDIAYTKSYKTTDKMKAANVKMIKKRLSKRGLLGVAIHSVKKPIIVWATGKDGFDASAGYGDNMGSLQKWISGDKDLIFHLFCQAYRALTLIFALLSAILALIRKNNKQYHLFLILTFLGSVLFYTFWETNEKHSICFMPILLLLFIDGIYHKGAITCLKRKQKRCQVS